MRDVIARIRCVLYLCEKHCTVVRTDAKSAEVDAHVVAVQRTHRYETDRTHMAKKRKAAKKKTKKGGKKRRR